jgi:hypothetical protein
MTEDDARRATEHFEQRSGAKVHEAVPGRPTRQITHLRPKRKASPRLETMGAIKLTNGQNLNLLKIFYSQLCQCVGKCSLM